MHYVAAANRIANCNGGNLFLPNTFSPNGDGKNDAFYPRGSGIRKIKSLRIFNRWGETVFTATDFDANDETAGWKGSYKGQPLPPGVLEHARDDAAKAKLTDTFRKDLITLLRKLLDMETAIAEGKPEVAKVHLDEVLKLGDEAHGRLAGENE